MNKHGTPADKRTSRRLRKKLVPEVSSPSALIKQSEARQSALKTEFRERLIARLEQTEVPTSKRMMYVAKLTGRAVQSVSRWFDVDGPVLPDLDSYMRLCNGLHCRPDAGAVCDTQPGT